MFSFFGDLKPKEWFAGAMFGVDIEGFWITIQENRVSCNTDQGYKNDFDSEIEEQAMRAMKCIRIAQAVVTSKKLSLEYLSWVEVKGVLMAEGDSKYVLGHFLKDSELNIDNKEFLENFMIGMRYAEQAFKEINMMVALEDFERSIDSEWDESIYHCQHCLEAVRDYFGEEKVGWDEMKKNLGLEESCLKSVTEFSSKYVRHGSRRMKLDMDMDMDSKREKAGQCKEICRMVLERFGEFLNGRGIKYSRVRGLN